MANTHQEWLDQLEEESRAKQDVFMNSIAGELGRPRVTEKLEGTIHVNRNIQTYIA